MAEQGRAGQGRAGVIAAIIAIVAIIIGGYFYWQSQKGGSTPTPVAVNVVPPTDKPAAPASSSPAEPPKAETAAANPPAASAPATAPSAAPAQTAAAPAAPAGSAAQPVPSFDVVRVEPDGSTVVAGRADPNAKVEVLDGADTVAKGVASSGGDWAMTLDKPLTPGPHDLSLRTTSPDGKTQTLSQQSVAVSVPETPKAGPLVVLDQSGAPSKVLQAPAAASAATATKPSVTVDAVAFQDGKLYISGSAAIGGIIRVYVDGVVVGDATADENGHWQITADRWVASGQHDIRADQIDGPSGHVVARAEVPFEQNGDVATLMAVKTEGGSTAGAASAGNVPDMKRVIIRRGDNLWTISRRLYGKGVRFSTIYEANSDQIRDPDLIYPGQVFLLPAGDTRWQVAPPVTK